MILRLLLTLLLSVSVHAAGTWNGKAITTWNGVAATSWNGTGISFGGAGPTVQEELNADVALYFKMDESAGADADDTGPNNLDATQSNTPGTRSGRVGTARDLISGDAERFTITDNAAFSAGPEVPISISVWALSDVFSANRGVVGQYDTTGNQRGYLVRYNSSNTRWEFLVSSNGLAIATAVANNFGAPSTGGWNHILAWHDPVANTINIRVNGGTVDSVSYSAGLHDSTAVFAIGSYAGANFFDGAIDEIQVSKRVWSDAAQLYLYDGGNGRTYPY